MKCSYPPRTLHSVVIKTRMEKNINKTSVIIWWGNSKLYSPLNLKIMMTKYLEQDLPVDRSLYQGLGLNYPIYDMWYHVPLLENAAYVPMVSEPLDDWHPHGPQMKHYMWFQGHLIDPVPELCVLLDNPASKPKDNLGERLEVTTTMQQITQYSTVHRRSTFLHSHSKTKRESYCSSVMYQN